MRQTLVSAMQRGVKVTIIVPGRHMDVDVVRRASRGLWGDLLQAGAEIYEYRPTMFHCKMIIVDELLVSVGSTNLDERSLRLNDEANLNIYDHDFAREQIVTFEQDLQRARRISYEDWRQRPLQEKVLEVVTSTLAPLL